MPVDRPVNATLYACYSAVHHRRGEHRLADDRELVIGVVCRTRVLYFTYLPGLGYVWSHWRPYSAAVGVYHESPFAWRWIMAVKRRLAPGQAGPQVPLPQPEIVLCGCSLLAEHITATTFEDGAPRVPGSFKVENMGTHFRCTVYDHDAGLRLPVTGPTLDEAFAGVEKLLAAIDAPWEVDQYLTGKVKQRPKPKKK
jgi:hypothetical protein